MVPAGTSQKPFRGAGMPGRWDTGMLGCRDVGTPGRWDAGTLGCQDAGTPVLMLNCVSHLQVLSESKAEGLFPDLHN